MVRKITTTADNVLTKELFNILTGKAATAFLVCCSPEKVNATHSLATAKFAAALRIMPIAAKKITPQCSVKPKLLEDAERMISNLLAITAAQEQKIKFLKEQLSGERNVDFSSENDLPDQVSEEIPNSVEVQKEPAPSTPLPISGFNGNSISMNELEKEIARVDDEISKYVMITPK